MNIELVNDENPTRFRLGVQGCSDMVFEILFSTSRSDGGVNHLTCGYVPIGDETQVYRVGCTLASMRSTRPGFIGRLATVRSKAWIPVISSVLTRWIPCVNSW